MNADLLLKLASHLNGGDLGHRFFDFATISDGERLPNGCGTAGCALGELPILFPSIWEFVPVIPGVDAFTVAMDGHEYTDYSACEFFQISLDEYEWLFKPDMFPAPWNEEPLEEDATRYDVARGIRNFVAWKQVGGDEMVGDQEQESVLV